MLGWSGEGWEEWLEAEKQCRQDSWQWVKHAKLYSEFWPTLGLTEGTFDTSECSVVGVLLSAPAVPHQKEYTPGFVHKHNNNKGNFYSILPIKNITTITSHRHTHRHTNTLTHLRITCIQNLHTKRLKIKPLELHLHSLSLSLLTHTQVQVTCSFTGGKVGWAVEHTEKF